MPEFNDDAEFLGLVAEDTAGSYRFDVVDHLARHDGHLYGGTAIAASITAAELISDRPAVWMTTQFIATAKPGVRISVLAEVLAPGRRTNQIRVTGTDPTGATMFASLGATGHHRPDGLSGVFEQAPKADRPEDSAQLGPFEAMVANAGYTIDVSAAPDSTGFTQVVEYRQPAVHHHPDPGPGRICFWVRRRDGIPVSPATVAFIADMVPLSVAHATGELAGGISLDNSIRIGAFEPTEWVLLDMRPHMAVGNYGHGAVHIWNEHGHLLATASQSASMLRFDPPTLGLDSA